MRARPQSAIILCIESGLGNVFFFFFLLTLLFVSDIKLSGWLVNPLFGGLIPRLNTDKPSSFVYVLSKVDQHYRENEHKTIGWDHVSKYMFLLTTPNAKLKRLFAHNTTTSTVIVANRDPNIFAISFHLIKLLKIKSPGNSY